MTAVERAELAVLDAIPAWMRTWGGEPVYCAADVALWRAWKALLAARKAAKAKAKKRRQK